MALRAIYFYSIILRDPVQHNRIDNRLPFYILAVTYVIMLVAVKNLCR